MTNSTLFLLSALWTCTFVVNVADYIRPPKTDEDRGVSVFFITVIIHLFNL
mgnify:CR=1 FL=1